MEPKQNWNVHLIVPSSSWEIYGRSKLQMASVALLLWHHCWTLNAALKVSLLSSLFWLVTAFLFLFFFTFLGVPTLGSPLYFCHCSQALHTTHSETCYLSFFRILSGSFLGPTTLAFCVSAKAALHRLCQVYHQLEQCPSTFGLRLHRPTSAWMVERSELNPQNWLPKHLRKSTFDSVLKGKSLSFASLCLQRMGKFWYVVFPQGIFPIILL